MGLFTFARRLAGLRLRYLAILVRRSPGTKYEKLCASPSPPTWQVEDIPAVDAVKLEIEMLQAQAKRLRASIARRSGHAKDAPRGELAIVDHYRAVLTALEERIARLASGREVLPSSPCGGDAPPGAQDSLSASKVSSVDITKAGRQQRSRRLQRILACWGLDDM